MDEEIGGAAAQQVTAPPHPLCSELVWGGVPAFRGCSDFVRFWSSRDPGSDELIWLDFERA